jgi:hypothetical protein
MAAPAPGDPMIAMLMDANLIDTVSTVMAKLERLIYDETRSSVFRTRWAKILFDECCRRLKLTSDNGPFDIDRWFQGIYTAGKKKTRREIDPSLYNQPIETNWLTALLALEMKCSGGSFIKVLHNVLELEDAAQAKLTKYCKEERQYDFVGSHKPSVSGVRLLAPAPAPAAGSIDELLQKTKPK